MVFALTLSFKYITRDNKMIKKAGLLMGLLVAANVNATVLTFDDIDTTSSYTPLSSLGESNYGGFTWDSDWALGTTDNSSYETGAYSGTQFLSNKGGESGLTISSDTLFDFDGAWFATPTHSNAASWVAITAYDEYDSLIGTTSEVSISTTLTWISALFEDVSYLVISTDDKWYTMDDFTYNSASTTSVPAPASFAFLTLGLAGLAFAKKKKLNK